MIVIPTRVKKIWVCSILHANARQERIEKNSESILYFELTFDLITIKSGIKLIAIFISKPFESESSLANYTQLYNHLKRPTLDEKREFESEERFMYPIPPEFQDFNGTDASEA